MTIIEAKKVKELFNLNLLYEIHRLRDKLKLFEVKHNMTFSDFELKIKMQTTENFAEWDDYMDWKACRQMKDKFDDEMKDLIDGNFKVS